MGKAKGFGESAFNAIGKRLRAMMPTAPGAMRQPSDGKIEKRSKKNDNIYGSRL